VRCLPQRTRSCFWDCYICATFGENRSRNATVIERRVRQTDRQTDTRTDRQKLKFIICPMLCAIAIGQIITVVRHSHRTSTCTTDEPVTRMVIWPSSNERRWSHQPSYATSIPVSTEMGDRSRVISCCPVI